MKIYEYQAATKVLVLGEVEPQDLLTLIANQIGAGVTPGPGAVPFTREGAPAVGVTLAVAAADPDRAARAVVASLGEAAAERPRTVTGTSIPVATAAQIREATRPGPDVPSANSSLGGAPASRAGVPSGPAPAAAANQPETTAAAGAGSGQAAADDDGAFFRMPTVKAVVKELMARGVKSEPAILARCKDLAGAGVPCLAAVPPDALPDRVGAAVIALTA